MRDGWNVYKISYQSQKTVALLSLNCCPSMECNKDVNASNALVSVTKHKKLCTLAMQPLGKENESHPVGKGKKVITDLYKPLTIQKSINLVFKVYTVLHATTSDGKLFYTLIFLFEKAYFLQSRRQSGLNNLSS
jgi:hypothetical protein